VPKGKSGSNPRQTEQELRGAGKIRERLGREAEMELSNRMLPAGGALLIAIIASSSAVAQKSGGTLNISHFDSPTSMSLHEEAMNRRTL